ncbi:hypothetical protein WICPIJ_004919 [Wickerhamomyces pijperi]|uniref:Uncharacterized protein n=1 Tax=Wickerhamomyces pijperi TaxID=599730 RepID=A0A9P8TLL9_WICPI|nr:hypothetical protein WICPIJ_004919 [Wickerhamomyces pijperi]
MELSVSRSMHFLKLGDITFNLLDFATALKKHTASSISTISFKNTSPKLKSFPLILHSLLNSLINSSFRDGCGSSMDIAIDIKPATVYPNPITSKLGMVICSGLQGSNNSSSFCVFLLSSAIALSLPV